MKKSPLMLLALLCLLLSNCKKEVNPVEPIVDAKVATFTDSLTTLFNASSLVGMTVSVVQDGAIKVQHSFGQANVANNTPYTNQTNQPIASVSKTFIGMALMKAIEEGHFTLETNINDILPFDIHNPNTPDAPIKVKHLVTHTAGLEDSEDTYELQYYVKEGENALLPTTQVIFDFGLEMGKGHALGDYLAAVYTPDGPLYDEDTFMKEGPGKVYEYSNIGASLAAYLIEVKTGQSFAAYVNEHILLPLNMGNTGYDRSQLASSELATLYVSKEYELPEYSHSSYPDGFVNTSNDALTKYLLEMLKGASGNGILLSKESYQTLFNRHSPDSMEEGEIHGVFWDLTRDGRIEHNGGDPGVLTLVSFDPVTNSGYLLMTNTSGGGLGEPLGVDDFVAIKEFFSIADYVESFEQN